MRPRTPPTYADYPVDDLSDSSPAYRLPRAPGEGYEYSNLGSACWDRRWRRPALATTALLSRIFDSLGMHDTAIALSPRLLEHLVQARRCRKPAQLWIWPMEGAGALRSTRMTLLLFEALMHPRPALSRERCLVTKPQRLTADATTRIALAWQVESRQSGPGLAQRHEGGYSAFVGFTADGESGVVVSQHQP